MAQFEIALSKVFFNEGGYSDNPNDSGGATNLGISLVFYRKNVKPDATKKDIKDLTVNDAAHLYKKYFWDMAPFAKINSQKVADRVFDLSVNMGVSSAISILQRAINNMLDHHILVDGVMGTKTVTAINALIEDMLYGFIISEAKDKYRDIVSKNPKNIVFYKGWLRRLAN